MRRPGGASGDPGACPGAIRWTGVCPLGGGARFPEVARPPGRVRVRVGLAYTARMPDVAPHAEPPPGPWIALPTYNEAENLESIVVATVSYTHLTLPTI